MSPVESTSQSSRNPSAGVAGGRASTPAEIDAAVAELKAGAVAFARLGAADRARLLRRCIPSLVAVAPGWVRAACEAKGIELGTPLEGEDWATGPFITIRSARLLAESLEAIAERGRPPLGTGVRVRGDGRLEVRLFPATSLEKLLWTGVEACALMEEGIDEAEAARRQASIYQAGGAPPRVCAVLGAGNVSSIPPTDVFHKLFVEGCVCLLKMNPVNEYAGPYLAAGLAPLIEAGCLRIVYGGPQTGSALVDHPGVDGIHITGSAETYDRIVWGPPGPDRERRRGEGTPLLTKSITAELGNVSPVVVVPAHYRPKELAATAAAVASMVVNNASFNCNAGKMLVVAEGWPQRAEFNELLAQALAAAPTRKAYYPGAAARYEDLLRDRSGVRRLGRPAEGELAWALVTGLDSARPDEPLFHVEPFCGIISETALPESEPDRFLAAATRFCNEKLWGTLNATIFLPPALRKQPPLEAALQAAVRELRYGTVGINIWPAVAYALACAPWGGHPGSSPLDIQSGEGWVHNSYLLDGVEKTVITGPLVPLLKPLWNYDQRQGHRLGPRLVELEADPGWARVPALVGLSVLG